MFETCHAAPCAPQIILRLLHWRAVVVFAVLLVVEARADVFKLAHDLRDFRQSRPKISDAKICLTFAAGLARASYRELRVQVEDRGTDAVGNISPRLDKKTPNKIVCRLLLFFNSRLSH